VNPAYEEYMRSDDWEHLKRTHPSKRECVACETQRNLQMHHMRYPADIWETRHSDCCWLCEGCHEAFHRACTCEREKYQAWAIYVDRTGMIIRAQRQEEECQPVAFLLGSVCCRPWPSKEADRAETSVR